MIETIYEPRSLPEALQLLHEHGDETKALAGGQSLLVLLRHRLLNVRSLVALRQVDGLTGIRERDGMLRVGALTTQRQLEGDQRIADGSAALHDAAMAVASTQVRNKGTLGGNLCHADPSADPPPALIALGARVELASTRGVRSLPVEELFADFLSVRLEPDELLTTIDVPVAPERSGSAYLKHSLRAVDPAVVGAAVWVQLDADGTCTDARVGLGGVGLTPLRARRTEDALRGSSLDAEALRAAAETAAAECDPLDDLEASAWYRRRLVNVYVQRAARAAIERARVMVSD